MNKYQKFCTGCGLCAATDNVKLKQNEKGFFYPESNKNMFKKVCPISGVHTKLLDKNNIWGRKEAVYLGWSKNLNIRNKASSGGILTEVACYLLKNNKVDAVIHVGANPYNPIKTETFFSTTPEEVILHCGSRYCISSPLLKLNEIDFNKKYAFIGKPCDIISLKNYMVIKPQLKETIPYLFSFFCMGLPSESAQIKLLKKLECKECKSLDYRGNGWPGFATAIDKDSKVHQITYDESWGEILGRDLMPVCKFCIDGIGEMADIACGDAWYLTSENTPDFSEHAGRNVVFARTIRGNELLNEMKKEECISLEQYENYQVELPLIQKSQWNRRREMRSRILAMKLLMRSGPSYNNSLLKSYSSGLSFKEKIQITIGTSKRILKGKV